jgi:hypothetical protein
MAAAHREVGESVERNYGDVTLALGSDGRYEFRNGTWASFLPGGLGKAELADASV